MLVTLRLLEYSAKIISPIKNEIKYKFSHPIKELTQFIHCNELPLFAQRHLLPTLKTLPACNCPANGKNNLSPNIRFSEQKFDPCKIRQMEFGRKHLSSLRKIIWRKRKKSRININQIISGALVNAATVQQNCPSNVDCVDMIKSYRDVVNANVHASQGRSLKDLITDIRQDVYTSYGKWIKDSWLDERAKRGTFIKVVSYNILAQNLLEMHPSLYREHDERYLSWSHRSYVLINELNRFDADILCLQEVEAEKVDFFNTQLDILGYKGCFKKRTNEKEDGCAIYFKESKFVVRECVSVEYYQPNVSLLNRDNIGIVLRLSPKGNPNQCIVVATTHLLFNPKRHDIKLAQMQILLAEIDRIAFKSVDASNEPSYYPIILSGDFNLQPHTHVYNLLTDGVVSTAELSNQNLNYQFKLPNKQLIPVRLGITDSSQHYHVTENRGNARTEISDFQYVKLFNTDRRSLMANDHKHLSWNRQPYFDFEKFGSGCLRHNLNLASVYPHDDLSARDATTFQDQWCTVDYIFYGPMQNTKSVSEKKVDSELKLVSYLRLPDTNQATCLGQIPNEVCPSDHLPLSAMFHLPIDVQQKCKH